MDYSNLMPLEMYCPNCGHKLRGFLNADGATVILCDRCKVKIYSKKKKNGFSMKVENN